MSFLPSQQWLILVFLLSLPAVTNASILARVNGEPILEEELQKNFPQMETKAALNRMILFRLATQQAKEQGLDSKPEVKNEIDKVLYKAYLSEVSAKEKQALEPTDKEIETYYGTQPYLRMRHLLLYARSEKEKAASEKTVSTIQAALKKKRAFKELVLKYSQDQSAKFAGDLDYRGAHSFPPEMYPFVKELKAGEITGPHFQGEAIHFFEVLDRKAFHQIPATYREYLKSELYREREMSVLQKQLESLKQKSKIVILSKEPE